jgi:hypothetical protein
MESWQTDGGAFAHRTYHGCGTTAPANSANGKVRKSMASARALPQRPLVQQLLGMQNDLFWGSSIWIVGVIVVCVRS